MYALLVTISTYGTWLHGDERGSINRKAPDGTSKYVDPDPVLNEWYRENLQHPVVKLDAKARRVVRVTIEEHCEFRGWHLDRLNVRTNHIHMIVFPNKSDGSDVLKKLKSRLTRMLREQSCFAQDQPIWTERGNVAELKTQKALDNARRYVSERQGKDLPEE